MPKQTTSIIMSLLILGAIGYLAYKSFNPSPFEGSQKETVATLVKTSAIKSGFAGYYEFSCSGQSVITKGSVGYSKVIGEKYRAIYDSLNCENLIIDWKHPVFLESEMTGTTIGEITISSSSAIVKPQIKFKYKVDEIDYSQVQYMEEDFEEQNSEVKVGAQFIVEYWLQNPQRSIMHTTRTEIK